MTDSTSEYVAVAVALARLQPKFETVEQARRELLRLASDGEITATAKHFERLKVVGFQPDRWGRKLKDGQRFFVPQQFWSEFYTIFRSERSNAGVNWESGRFHAGSMMKGKLDEETTLELLAVGVNFSTDGLPCSLTDTKSSISRSKVGRKPLPVWENIWCEICRRVHDDGPWASQADAVRYLQDWCQEQGFEVPNDSGMKQRVSKLWRALKFD